ncbi:MAG: Maf family protein, partial [Candidatus Wildermuthbacteria bacterium]|nr:Maf family protein [Candidatus Wildermuthbacteria bacterium]
MKKVKLILASRSPRRIRLLKMLGWKFKIMPSRIKEKINPRLSPIQNVKNLSRQKAQAVAAKASDGIIIAADSIVVLNGEILGKPKNIKESEKMLQKL